MSASVPNPSSPLPRDLFLLPRQNDGFQIPFFLSTEEEAAKVRPPAVVKTLEARLRELSVKQQETLRDFKRLVKSTPWYNENEHDDWMLIRYLIARNFDKKKSFAMIEKSVKWHKEKDVDNWVCDTCLVDPNKHLMQFVGWDLQSRPVCFMTMRWGPERKHPLKHCVSAFNHLVKLMPVGVEQWVCVTDFETFSYVKDNHPRMALSVVSTIQDHFPERLGLMILVNAPRMFAVLWAALSPAIEEKTRAKVLFLYTKSKPKIQTEFANIFPAALAEYLCESYRRSEGNVLPTAPVWYPAQRKE
ncbi:cellular retinaldehyde-binding protein/triple function domain-containing protein [Trypanosoma conorhini]|uniref:Cellular retinaldehyde-binding protein/triple function domain-containing protein n=1 Tax=Trypanosoma conorhini TaxID=83891 RepID=A0A422PR80_9TRYP|nr:cellular retinaldehyde-binding protein/triple function domain-containing protein [Trypanosoma conorhini]RNF20256.1 cellular retinaldehyde-binding protein/triple function domain-containing protein [Trypanosoma conorhini]